MYLFAFGSSNMIKIYFYNQMRYISYDCQNIIDHAEIENLICGVCTVAKLKKD